MQLEWGSFFGQNPAPADRLDISLLPMFEPFCPPN